MSGQKRTENGLSHKHLSEQRKVTLGNSISQSPLINFLFIVRIKSLSLCHDIWHLAGTGKAFRVTHCFVSGLLLISIQIPFEPRDTFPPVVPEFLSQHQQ